MSLRVDGVEGGQCNHGTLSDRILICDNWRILALPSQPSKTNCKHVQLDAIYSYCSIVCSKYVGDFEMEYATIRGR